MHFRLLVLLCFFLTLCCPPSAQATWQATLDEIQSATNQVMLIVSNEVATTVQTATNNFIPTVTNIAQSVGGISATTVTNIANSTVQNATNNLMVTVTNIVQSVGGGISATTATNIANSIVQGATNGFGDIVTHSASELKAMTVWSGTSRNSTLAASGTYFASPNNTFTMGTSDVSGGTRVPVTRSITLTNLYVVTSGAVGGGHTDALTIMTNGAATPLAVNISGSSQTSGNDTTDSVTIPAGMEIGVRIVTTYGSTAVKWEWSFEGH